MFTICNVSTSVGRPHVGDEGVEIVVSILQGAAAANLTNATALAIVFLKPDGTVVVVVAEVDGDPAEGRIKVISGVGADEVTLDQHGQWMLQARIVTPFGRWTSSGAPMNVASVLSPWP